jgi:hypothetical protein
MYIKLPAARMKEMKSRVSNCLIVTPATAKKVTEIPHDTKKWIDIQVSDILNRDQMMQALTRMRR